MILWRFDIDPCFVAIYKVPSEKFRAKSLVESLKYENYILQSRSKLKTIILLCYLENRNFSFQGKYLCYIVILAYTFIKVENNFYLNWQKNIRV